MAAKHWIHYKNIMSETRAFIAEPNTFLINSTSVRVSKAAFNKWCYKEIYKSQMNQPSINLHIGCIYIKYVYIYRRIKWKFISWINVNAYHWVALPFPQTIMKPNSSIWGRVGMGWQFFIDPSPPPTPHPHPRCIFVVTFCKLSLKCHPSFRFV